MSAPPPPEGLAETSALFHDGNALTELADPKRGWWRASTR